MYKNMTGEAGNRKADGTYHLSFFVDWGHFDVVLFHVYGNDDFEMIKLFQADHKQGRKNWSEKVEICPSFVCLYVL